MFPTLIFTGVSPINANATNAVALWPGVAASAGAYRRELGNQQRTMLLMLSGISLLGGVFGALLLLRTTQATFSQLVPYLLLFATLLFTFSGSATGWLRSHLRTESLPGWLMLGGAALLQLVTAIYGGFFGGGIGIIMLAILGIFGMRDIHSMNALKTLLAGVINGIAVIIFVLAGIVAWPQATVAMVGAIAGGYGGAYYARQLNPLAVRRFVIVVGFAMTLYFFLRGA